MFNSLFKLYHKSNTNIPLEDFTTEGFAGILKMFPEIFESFCYDFLGIPKDVYKIQTQYLQTLNVDDPNCIIDLVFLGEQNTCFIEIKVESTEGYKQLERYQKALETHHLEKKQFLFYCTKYTDSKLEFSRNISSSLNFNQFRWFKVAKFLRQFQSDLPIVERYLEFLKKNKMSQDNTLKSENLVSMENLQKTIEIAEFHINNSEPIFDDFFGGKNLKRGDKWVQLNKNRVCRYTQNILPCASGAYTEVLYSIQFDKLKLIAQIFVQDKHKNYDKFNLALSENNNRIEVDKGLTLRFEEDLGKYLNDEKADEQIKKWFGTRFEELARFIENNRDLSWQFSPRSKLGKI